MHSRLVRYCDLVPCRDAFIDTRTPGSDAKENFTIIGPGVSENPKQHVHIAEPHGFNIGGARQPAGCTNSQHSHDTAEVFFVHSGTWEFRLGEHGTDASIVLEPGELISIPTKVFRGFENVGEGEGFLWAVLGGDDPGRVLWAPKVFEMAEDYGLVLLENGNLVDIGAGESLPDGAQAMPVTSAAQVEALQVIDDEGLAACCVTGQDALAPTLIGPDGKLDWEHGFTLHRIVLDADESVSEGGRNVPDVVFLHRGNLCVVMGDETVRMVEGDTLTVPQGISRSFQAVGEADFVRVLGT